jgi:hypothetical protein
MGTLVRLAGLVDWGFFDQRFSARYAEGGRPGIAYAAKAAITGRIRLSSATRGSGRQFQGRSSSIRRKRPLTTTESQA